MKFVDQKISRKELVEIAKDRFGDMVKAVVDIRLGVMIIGADLHADEEAELLERDSAQQDLWGINIYVDKPVDERVAFDSVINIRPNQNNRSRDVLDANTRQEIIKLVNKLIE